MRECAREEFVKQDNVPKLMERIRKADRFFADPTVSQKEKDAHLDLYRQLWHQVAVLSGQFYSRKLELKFEFDQDTLDMVFEDGVRYTTEEQAILLYEIENPCIRGIHAAKKKFDGVLLETRNEGKQGNLFK